MTGDGDGVTNMADDSKMEGGTHDTQDGGLAQRSKAREPFYAHSQDKQRRRDLVLPPLLA